MRFVRFALLSLLALPAIVLGDGRAVPAHSAPITGEPVSQALLGNGRLQVHHIDVEQGDGALIISPNGQLAMVDSGRWTHCSNVVRYLQSLGITSIDYHFASHYHADHIGCLDDMAAAGIGVAVACYDRGSSVGTGTFSDYETTCGPKRQTLSKGQVITLDQGAQQEVAITVVDLNGAGVYGGDDENALSVVLKVSYGAFDEVMGGDLTGISPEPEVESTVGPLVGDVEVYKVHHHGSATSTNDDWLNATTPEVGIISVGNNSYGHPTAAALARLHNHGVKTYWTNSGSGAAPDPVWDKIGGTILVEADPGADDSYTVYGSCFADCYDNDGVGDACPLPPEIEEAVWRPSNGTWYVRCAQKVQWGLRGDIPVPSDYKGTDKTDIAVWRPSNGTWYVRGAQKIQWGMRGDIPVPSDYKGTDKTDIAVWRPSNGKWYVRGAPQVQWGMSGDIPVPGDYKGDDKTDLAVWRPSNGKWYVRGGQQVQWGLPGDIPVPGDYNNDGKTDFAVWRPSNGKWYVRGIVNVQWGMRGDIPVPGDYKGDPKTDVAVWRPSKGMWYVRGIAKVQWGLPGDIPVPEDYY